MRLRAHQRAFRSPFGLLRGRPVKSFLGIVRFLMECQAMLSALPDNYQERDGPEGSRGDRKAPGSVRRCGTLC